jgi:hypothetical protein
MSMSVPNEIKEPESFAGTVHIHLDQNKPPDRTQVCRFLLDTGADLNLVAERVLKDLGMPLPNLENEPPTLTGLGDVHVLPIGSVILTFHIDGKTHDYSEMFWIISENTPALFDLLFGNRWIKHHKALRRNPTVYFSRPLRGHNSRNPT